MFNDFDYRSVKLEEIFLDYQNPRIVTPNRLKTQDAIVSYMFAHTKLLSFIQKIFREGKNRGAETPYIIKSGDHYVVVEGNTRIAAYKLLTGLLKAPPEYAGKIPAISKEMKEDLLSVSCSIAPDRDTLSPIMANAHFGLGDKSKWGYLGSRKAVYDEWKSGKTIDKLSEVFNKNRNEIINYLMEYTLYLEALKFDWTQKQKEQLIDPEIKFNPPVRFLQGSSHKEKMGIEYDTENIKIIFKDDLSRKKYKHLIYKLVLNLGKGLKAISSYEDVFKDFTTSSPLGGQKDQSSEENDQSPETGEDDNSSDDRDLSPSPPKEDPKPAPKPKPLKNALFSYESSSNSELLINLANEARRLSIKQFPCAGTFLLRNIVEAILKELIVKNDANGENNNISLESALGLCMGQKINIPKEDKKILGEFRTHHLNYLNLGAHGNIVPNENKLRMARDCIALFVRKYG